MKKNTLKNEPAQGKKSHLFLWLFIFVIFTFALSLLWARFTIFESFRQNNFEKAVLKLKNRVSLPIKIVDSIVQELEVLTLNDAQKNIDELSFLMSHDGQSIAYIFNDVQTNKKIVSLNGQPGAPYDDITFMKFSVSGERFAYGVKRDGKDLVVLDGQEGRAYDWIFEPHFFSPDNQYFIYKARDIRGDVLVFNNWESQVYDRIYGIVINSSQTKLIFYARRGDKIWQGTANLTKPLEINLDLQDNTNK